MSTTFDPLQYKNTQKSAWSMAAEKWDAGIAVSFISVSRQLVSFTGIAPAARVLDLATGNGIAGFAAADAGASEVIATDIAHGFGPVLERRAREFGFADRVRFQEADLESIPFADAHFDAVLCQFGLMFAPNRPGAFREMNRILRKGGMLGAAVWCSAEENAAWAPVIKCLLTRLPPTPEGTPTLFACGASGLMKMEALEAGFSDYEETKVDVVFRFENTEAAWQGWQGTGPFQAALPRLSEGARKSAEEEIRGIADLHKTKEGSVELPAKALFFRARNV